MELRNALISLKERIDKLSENDWALIGDYDANNYKDGIHPSDAINLINYKISQIMYQHRCRKGCKCTGPEDRTVSCKSKDLYNEDP